MDAGEAARETLRRDLGVFVILCIVIVLFRDRPQQRVLNSFFEDPEAPVATLFQSLRAAALSSVVFPLTIALAECRLPR